MKQIQDDDEEREAFPKWIVIVSALLLLGVGSFITYGVLHPDTFKANGTWGDFVGGTLNPILTFLTVIGLLVTIHLQQRELRLTRKELAKSSNALEAQNLTTKQQRFENTLFSMIEMLNQIVNAMDVDSGDGLKSSDEFKSGRDCFSHFYNNFNIFYFRRSWTQNPYFHDVDLKRGEYINGRNYIRYDIYYPHDCFRAIEAYNY